MSGVEQAEAMPSPGERARPAHKPVRLTEEHQERILSEFHSEAQLDPHYDLRLLARVWPYLRRHILLMGGALVLVPLTIAATLRQPLATKHAVDGVVSGDMEMWRSALLVYAVAVGIEFVTRFVQVYCMQLSGQRAMVDLRNDVYAHTQRLRLRFYDHTPVGRILTRVTNDVDALGELFSSGAVMAVADLLMLFGIVGHMLWIDVQLTLVTLAALPPLALAVEWIRRKARVSFRNIRARVAQLNAYLSEQVQGVQVVQAFGREDVSAEEYRIINDAHRLANYSAIRYDAMLYSLVETCSISCVALVLFYAGVKAGAIDDQGRAALYLGTVVAFYQYIQQFFVPIRDLSTKYTIIQSALAAAERVFGFLDTDDVDRDSAHDMLEPDPSADPLIALERVHLEYRPGEPVLRDVSLRVGRGEHVAIVGATGAGKTSTISLLLRFYEISKGSVRVGGHDIRTMERDRLRSMFAVVPQDVFLFQGTVGENVAMGPVVDREGVERALARVGALDLLATRGGMDATVGERGGNFSAGERQLIAFARALYRDAPVLILDEATANIDSETEARLQQAVATLIRGRTAIVIAHRLSTIRQADRIAVFHHGAIVEEGTHDELLEKGQVYAHLHQLQFDAEDAPAS
ncbi:MAG: ABC transporter ATP-binding protein [Myxococcales bacterium]|nr:ABC transporter ATP-binding protein [Myxococcales bacterium]